MRSLVLAICVLISVAAVSRSAVGLDSSRMDLILSRIWVEIPGISGLAALTGGQQTKVGSLYVPRPLESADALLLGMENLPPLAVKLDSRLNPVPGFVRDLPDLAVLAGIQNEQVLRDYFNFLIETSKGYGIDFLVLPDTDPNWRDANSLVEFMAAIDPGFFIRPDYLTRSQVSKKKEIEAVLSTAGFWVISDEAFEPQMGQIREYRKLKFQTDSVALTLSENARKPAESRVVRDHLPNKLAFQITREAIIPLQRGSVLPLATDTISLITNDPVGSFATMLGKYAYLLTTWEGISQSHSPVVIDGQMDSLPEIDPDRIVIVTGTLHEVENRIAISDAALVIPFHKEWNDYILPQLIFGVAGASGKLPDHIDSFDGFENETLEGNSIIGYVPPGLMGLNAMAIDEIQKIVTEAISTKSTPGCQIGVAIGGAIVFEEAFGFLTYDSLIKVEKNTLFDIASVSKVTGTLLAVMKLYEEGKMDLDKSLEYYLPEYANGDKASITIRHVLSHQSGLKGYVPYWRRVLDPDLSLALKEGMSESGDGVLFSPDLLMDSLRSWILHTPVNAMKDSSLYYRYSDIGFMILHQMIERITGMKLEDFLQQEFYSKMGLKETGYNPLDRGYSRYQIAPTEYDPDLRDELIWGDVHDQNAKIFGGVAGHAGLFSNVHEMLVILEMIQQGGRYNGHQLLSQSTIDAFNTRYFENNRRGLGWDKPGGSVSNASKLASDESFGHSGFTGCLIWCDPVYDVSFVFLSNRIYPNSRNMNLITKDIRVRIQNVFYEAILANWIN